MSIKITRTFMTIIFSIIYCYLKKKCIFVEIKFETKIYTFFKRLKNQVIIRI